MIIHGYAAAEPGGNFEPFEYEPKPLKPNEIGVRVVCSGLCHSDLHMLDNDWGITTYPFVPGHEVIGVVREVGEAVTHLKAGQRVGIGWQSASCMHCESCRSGDNHLCGESEGTCAGRYGGFADYVQVDSRFAIPIPDAIDSRHAGPLLCGGVTVFSSLFHYGVRSTMKVGVVGIGGLGHMAIRFARAFGCEVYAFSHTAAKEAEAMSFGATHFINSRDENAVGRVAGSLDFILSTVFAQLDWGVYLNALRPHGRLCLVASPTEDISIPPMSLLLGQRSLSGSIIGSPQMLYRMLDFAARHDVVPQIELMPMAQINDAFEKVRRNEARYRIVLSNE